MTAASDAISFLGVTKRFRQHEVVSDIHLSVAPGTCTGLVGANGAGKTTLIKCLLDFVRPDHGTISIFNQSSLDYRARGQLAYLPEKFQPPYYLRGRDMLDYFQRMYGTQIPRQSMQSLFEELDLELGVLDKPVRYYSKGMAQKLGLAACLLSGRKLLVLDEPMSGLDPKGRYGVKKVLRRMHEQGTTLFFSSHLLADVEALCDSLIILHGHRIQFQGTPQDCCERFRSKDLEQAYMNCINQASSQA